MKVYFIQESETLNWKIGISKNVKGRLSSLRTANPRKLELIGAIPGDRQLEQDIHSKLSEFRLEGEWFQNSETVIQLVDNFLNPKRIPVVYFAGKVFKGGGYRSSLIHGRVMSNGNEVYELKGKKFVYGGPFAFSCDHGCFHSGGSHGMVNELGYCNGLFYDEDKKENWFEEIEIEQGEKTRELCLKTCIEQIKKCDRLHAYIESFDCYGTLVEIGYASALGKDIYIVVDPKVQEQSKAVDELWFVKSLPNVKSMVGGANTIHEDLLKMVVIRKKNSLAKA